jgi:hypothetical protein
MPRAHHVRGYKCKENRRKPELLVSRSLSASTSKPHLLCASLDVQHTLQRLAGIVLAHRARGSCRQPGVDALHVEPVCVRHSHVCRL